MKESDDKINLLNGAGATIFSQEKAGTTDNALQFVIVAFNLKRGLHSAEIDGPNLFIGEGEVLIVSAAGFDPYCQLSLRGVALINKAVTVIIVGAQIGEAVATLCAE